MPKPAIPEENQAASSSSESDPTTNSTCAAKCRLLPIGGQAVLEGVMMRGPRSFTVVVRRPDGTLAVKEDRWLSWATRWRITRWPFVRGSLVLLETLVNGLQALNFSAAQALQEEEPESNQSLAVGITLLIAMALGIGFFVVLPHLLSAVLGHFGPLRYDVNSFLFHLVDSVIKVLLFVGYLVGIAFLPDIRRVFQYHGAEHKSIHTYESGEELTVANAARHSMLHPRCGTAFLLVVLVVSLATFAWVIPLLPFSSAGPAWLRHLSIVAVKIGLMFPVAGIAYEFIKWSGRHQSKRWVLGLCQPGLWLQRLTTREPSADQLEVALHALHRALQIEQQKSS
jgi:uncharacterized protein YqhQ